LSEATAKWVSSTYPVGRLVFRTDSLAGRGVMRAYRAYRRRQQPARSQSLEPAEAMEQAAAAISL
ncbi:MAG TPA: hypothetical protein VFE24_02375, partial [Pirellulales bacterium]|nr:hypothetical protein [Pirellulales bacterium]